MRVLDAIKSIKIEVGIQYLNLFFRKTRVALVIKFNKIS